MIPLQVSFPIAGTYLIHEAGQPAVEGVAVYLYKWGWSCEDHSTNMNTTQPDCEHVKLAKEWDRDN